MDQGATSKPISHQLHTYTSPKLLCSLGLIMHLGQTFLRKKKNHRILCKINEKDLCFQRLKMPDYGILGLSGHYHLVRDMAS